MKNIVEPFTRSRFPVKTICCMAKHKGALCFLESIKLQQENRAWYNLFENLGYDHL